MKKCPWCAEEVKDEAILCRYCGRSTRPQDMPPTNPAMAAAMATGVRDASGKINWTKVTEAMTRCDHCQSTNTGTQYTPWHVVTGIAYFPVGTFGAFLFPARHCNQCGKYFGPAYKAMRNFSVLAFIFVVLLLIALIFGWNGD